MAAFYDYVAAESGAFRLVFESDLTNEPAVRDQTERVTRECARMIAEVIHEDTRLPDEAAHLLAVSLVGMDQVSARYWLDDASSIRSEERRVGQECVSTCRSRWAPGHYKTNTKNR